MAQMIHYPQSYLIDENTLAANTANDPAVKAYRKRRRDELDHGTSAPKPSRQRTHLQDHSVPKATGKAKTSKKPTTAPPEVISLLDDDEGLQPAKKFVKAAQPLLPGTEHASYAQAPYQSPYGHSAAAVSYGVKASYQAQYAHPHSQQYASQASYAVPYPDATSHGTSADSYSKAYYPHHPSDAYGQYAQSYAQSTTIPAPETTAASTYSDYHGHAASDQRYISYYPEDDQSAAQYAYATDRGYYAQPILGNLPGHGYQVSEHYAYSPFDPAAAPNAMATSEVYAQHPASTMRANPYKPIVRAPMTAPGNEAIDDVVPILEPTLCAEQAQLVDLIMSRRNVFYTGSAGCGKSTVLKAFVKKFKERGLTVNIVAPTGRAALDINGSTTWTYAGWTPDHHKKPLKELKIAAHGKWVSKRLQETNVLVIDEISMVENLHFERLNAIMKEARNDDRAFGGVQLVVTGDFCQLPPVKPFRHCIECGKELVKNKDETEYKCRQHGTYYDKDKWAFRSQAWKECDFAHVNLTEIHRQSDKVFIDMLNKLRMGNPLKQNEIDLLLNHKSETRNAIKLFATRDEVKRVNDQMFNNLPTKARPYQSFDHFHWNPKHFNLENKGSRGPDGSILALREHRLEPQVQLKKGMLVVLLHNLDLASGLVNGSQGTIQGFEPYAKTKLPKAAANKTVRSSKMEDASNAAPEGTTLQGDHAAYREARIADFAEKMEYKGWPIVRFLNGVERTIYADCTVNLLGDEAPHSMLSRTQIPLMAAWAMTTHKSQGMTLNRVIVNLAKSFEQGQAYVALSRARSLNGLKVESFPPSAQGKGNPQVKEFLRERFGIE